MVIKVPGVSLIATQERICIWNATWETSRMANNVIHVCRLFVPTLFLAGTDLAGVSPALARHPSAAALYLGGVLGFWNLAVSVFKLRVAVVHTYI